MPSQDDICHSSVPPAVFSRLNILIADSNRHMRSLLKGVLRTLGLRKIRETTDGPSVLKELQLVPIDLLITEYALETLDGHDLTRLIRTASDIGNPFVPIIMISGHTEQHIVAKARDAGVNEFLAKPISAEALYSRLVGVVFHPRDFVQTHGYVGPDRRRHHPFSFKGVNRRTFDVKKIRPPPLLGDENLTGIASH